MLHWVQTAVEEQATQPNRVLLHGMQLDPPQVVPEEHSQIVPTIIILAEQEVHIVGLQSEHPKGQATQIPPDRYEPTEHTQLELWSM